MPIRTSPTSSASAPVRPSQIRWQTAPSMEQAKRGRILEVGHRGPAIKELQTQLNALLEKHPSLHSFEPLDADGAFGPQTEAVVRWAQARFETADGKKSGVDSKVGPLTLAAIENGSRVASAPVVATDVATDVVDSPVPRRRPTQPVTSTVGALPPEPSGVTNATAPRTNTRTVLGLTGRVGFGQANKPEDVSKVQRSLVRHGYLRPEQFRNNRFDDATAAALRQFQMDQTKYRDVRVDVGGALDRALASESLPKAARYLNLSGPVGLVDPHGRTRSDPADVEAVQQRLLTHGYLLPGEFNAGQNDQATIDAIFHFQRDQLGHADGVVSPGERTSNALKGDHLARPRTGREHYDTGGGGTVTGEGVTGASGDPAAVLNRSVPWGTDASAATDPTTRAEAIRSAQANKTFFAEEPRTGVNGLAMPPWFNADQFLATKDSKGQPLRTVGADGRPVYSALTGVRTDYQGSQLISGGTLTTGTGSTHFIVHETDGLSDVARFRRDDRQRTSVSMFIGRDDERSANDGHYLVHDFDESRSGTKWVSRAENRVKRKNLGFVSIELVTPHIKQGSSQDQTYTDGQYRDLAIAYVMASRRAGRLLTITPHKEIDRGIPGGHTDPRDLDWNRFYGEINLLLGMPPGTTYGYPPVRDTGSGARNLASHANTFPNIYASNGDGIEPQRK